MTPGDAGRVIAACMMFDGRELPDDHEAKKTFIMSWFSVIGDLDLNDALEAVRRHYMTSAKWAMPVHIRDGVKAIQAERSRREPPHESRALPGRFEKDVAKQARVKRGVTDARTALEKVFEVMALKNGSPAALSALDQLREMTEPKNDDTEGGTPQ